MSNDTKESSKIQGILDDPKRPQSTRVYFAHNRKKEVVYPPEPTWWSRMEIYEATADQKTRRITVWTPSPESEYYREICVEVRTKTNISPEEAQKSALQKAEKRLKPYAFLMWCRAAIKAKHKALYDDPEFKKHLRNLVAEWPISQPESWPFIVSNLKLDGFESSHFFTPQNHA